MTKRAPELPYQKMAGLDGYGKRKDARSGRIGADGYGSLPKSVASEAMLTGLARFVDGTKITHAEIQTIV